MIGHWKVISDCRLTIGEAWERTTRLIVVSVFFIVLVLFVATAPATAQANDAACEQYGCAADPAPVYSSHPPSSPTPTHREPAPTPDSASVAAPYEEGTSAPQGSGPVPDEAIPSYEQPVEEPDDSTEGLLQGYPYDGETCDKSDCGLKAIEDPLQCVTYETASGKNVFGCADPSIFDEQGCYEITFYTEEGEPYSNLDTCSGEKPYAPPEPPDDSFRYWEPPDTPHQSVYGSWMPVRGSCRHRSGDIDDHCGLEDIPAGWRCEIFYDTVHGTVRGCYEEEEVLKHDSHCINDLHLYDEAGRFLGTYRQCPRVSEEYCSENQCAIHDVPDGWWCRTEEWNYGDLYGGKHRVYTRCADPRAEQYLTGEIPPKPNRMCGHLWDEQGRVIDDTECSPGQGDSEVGFWAGKEAEEADNTLNVNDSSSSPGRSFLPSHGTPDLRAPPDGSPEEPEEPVSFVVDVITNLLNSESSSADPQASAKLAELTSSELTDAPTDKISVSLNDEHKIVGETNQRESAGRRSRDETDTITEVSIRSHVQEAALVDTVYHDARRPYASQAHGDRGRKSSGQGLQDGRSAKRSWPVISAGVREATDFVAGGDGADGWLGAVIPLTSLGIAGGVFALRTRFLR